MLRFLCVFLYGSILFATTQLSFAESLVNPSYIKIGDYLRADYIEILGETKSPAIAITKLFSEPVSITTRKSERGVEFGIGYNFHEGGVCFFVQESGKIVKTPEECGGYYLSNLSLQIKEDGGIILGFDKFKKMEYSFVDDAEKYVALKSISGNYIDSAGTRYSFGTDGVAKFGSTVFKYSVMLDYVERGGSEHSIVTVFPDEYEFEYDGQDLKLYKSFFQEERPKENPPVHILHLIAD